QLSLDEWPARPKLKLIVANRAGVERLYCKKKIAVLRCDERQCRIPRRRRNRPRRIGRIRRIQSAIVIIEKYYGSTGIKDARHAICAAGNMAGKPDDVSLLQCRLKYIDIARRAHRPRNSYVGVFSRRRAKCNWLRLSDSVIRLNLNDRNKRCGYKFISRDSL